MKTDSFAGSQSAGSRRGGRICLNEEERSPPTTPKKKDGDDGKDESSRGAAVEVKEEAERRRRFGVLRCLLQSSSPWARQRQRLPSSTKTCTPASRPTAL